jgi:hypothetical protein
MNNTLTKIVEDWIGLDRTFPEWESDEEEGEWIGYNKALADIRSRVPELVENILHSTIVDLSIDDAKTISKEIGGIVPITSN